MSKAEELPSWRDTATRRSIVEFVRSATEEGGSAYIPAAERIAVFDNDGTLWAEKPMPIQLDFIMRGFAEAAQRDPALQAEQPFKAAHERDFGWLGQAIVKLSGGDRDFMRPVAERIYQIPRERVVGSGFGVEYRDGTIVYSSKLDAFDDGPEKPLRIWARTGRRPAIAAGNSNGDLEMLGFAGGEGKPALRLVVRHDDDAREVAYTAGAERVLDAGFTEISMRDDWATVFGAHPTQR